MNGKDIKDGMGKERAEKASNGKDKKVGNGRGRK